MRSEYVASPKNVYVTRREAAELSGASATVINKAIEQKVIPTHKSTSGALLDVRDVAALVLFAALSRFGLPVSIKRAVRNWLRDAETAELTIGPGVVIRRSDETDAAARRAESYVQLRDRFLEVNSQIRGGEPVIRGTRVPIRGLAKQVEAGETLEILREDYPNIPDEAFEFSVLWAKAHPRRGRPTPSWTENGRPEPRDRAARVQERRTRIGAAVNA